jgi:recombinational DNA repair ATPase RecF
MAEEPAAIKPSLKITGLHIAGYRSIRQLDWPQDGLGWNGTVPDIVLVGGANGSGKTTLLEGLFSVFDGSGDIDDRPVFRGADELRLDLRVSSEIFPGTRDLCLAIGDVKFVEAQQKTEDF